MMFIGVPLMVAGFFAVSVAPNFATFIVAFLLGMVWGLP